MTSLTSSTERLDKALTRLESAIEGFSERSGDPALARKELAAMIEDRAYLAQQLDDALARERELQALADEASEALGSAIAEVRAALGRQGQS